MKTMHDQSDMKRALSGKIISSLSIILLAAVILLLSQACSKKNCNDPCADGCGECPDICKTDPCGNPVECPGLCPTIEDGTLSKNNLKGSGTVVETEDGMSVDGSLTITTPNEEEVVLEDAEIIVEYNEDGTVKKMEGKATVPSPTNYMEFSDPVQADLGYYTGKYLNDNWDLDITLVDERFYLAFKIALSLELKVGAKDDPNATKPLSIKPPVGGHILYIFDYTDPFYFYSAAQDALGSMCFGESLEGNIPYVPIQPVEKIVTFDGKSVRCGTFPVFKVIEVSGTMIQATNFNVELVEENPFPLNFSAGYAAGINGSFELSLPINNWITFAIPLGEASAAITVEGGTGGVKAEAFINGLAKPDNSWWPDIIPVKPGGQIRTAGYVQQAGQFDLELSGAFNLELPTNTYAVEGALAANNDAFSMSGKVLANGLEWEAGAEFRKDETEFSAKPPQDLMNNINSLVNDNIDSAFTKAENALADLEKATKDYEFELSLRGFRSAIPTIVTEAKKRIAAEIKAGIASGRSQADKILSDNGYALCSDNISSVVNKLDDPYINALNRLNKAASSTVDDAQARVEIEGALRDLAKLQRLKKSVSVTITAGNKEVKVLGVVVTKKCNITKSFKRTVDIDVQVLTNDQVNQLLFAADNVKYIASTSDIKIKAQEVFDKIPATEIIQQLKSDIQSGVKTIPSIGEVGFVKNHKSGTYTYFWVVDGERKDLNDVNIFDPNSISQAIIDDLL